MKKFAINGVIAGLVLGLVLSGCGDDRSHPKNGIKGSSISYANPTAVIDINSTTHRPQPQRGFDVYRYDSPSAPFILDGKDSHDNDERGEKIASYDWNITSSFGDGCLDLNNTGSSVIMKVCEEAYNDGNITVRLTVTDDEGAKDSTSRVIKLN